MKIELLSDHVINQIAAGEVIENPASVIKELLDNAVDAGAAQIEIEIVAGGQQLIRVADDGRGMSSEDVQMCLLRHATSKIRELGDLDSLSTMGFRGEALAAIAAISKLEIRTSDGQQGTRLVADGGQIVCVEPCARNRGTTIEVRSLFFNTPARRKFQKSPSANASQIHRMVSTFSLSMPQIHFRLESAGETVIDYSSGQWKERIQEVLGDVVQNGVWFEQKNLIGWIGLPDEARATRSLQHFFINRRLVFSPILSKAVKMAYGTRIAEGSHPAAVLFYECSPDDFDVNVHPQKKEIRFRDEGKVYSQIHGAVISAFIPKDLPQDIPHFEPRFLATDPWEQPGAIREETARFSSVQNDFCSEEPTGQPLAVVGSFLLVERDGAVKIVDLREEREKCAQEKGEAQALMVPVLCSVEGHLLQNIVQRCLEAGIEAKAIGTRQISVDAIPTWMSVLDVNEWIDCIKDETVSLDEAIHRFCQKNTRTPTLEEARFLWRRQLSREVSLDAADLERIIVKKS